MILITFKAFSGVYFNKYLINIDSSVVDVQHSFWGDNTQFTRYRMHIDLNYPTKLTIAELVNGATNNALVSIDRLF